MDKEIRKLSDLQWEYHMSIKTGQDKEIVRRCREKFMKQKKKVLDMQKTCSNEQK